MKKIILLLAISIILLNCKPNTKKALKNVGTTSEKAMVVSAREEASKIGLDILKKGGNAFDCLLYTSPSPRDTQ